MKVRNNEDIFFILNKNMSKTVKLIIPTRLSARCKINQIIGNNLENDTQKLLSAVIVDRARDLVVTDWMFQIELPPVQHG